MHTYRGQRTRFGTTVTVNGQPPDLPEQRWALTSVDIAAWLEQHQQALTAADLVAWLERHGGARP